MSISRTLALAALSAGLVVASSDELIRRAASVVPTRQQLAWHEMELTAFIHFTINTFTDKEWGDGTEDPKLFDPTAFDARQWARVLKDAGFKLLILTAKHHDGFCLWPSKYTEHSVKNSPWRGGKGDVVREVAEACRAEGLKFGIYLSPWDRHEPTYGTPAYNGFYKNQLRELLTSYGEIFQIWLDGAKGKGEKAHDYDWEGYYQVMRELQPDMLIKAAGDRDAAKVFADGRVRGPEIRWIGNELGIGRETEWSVIPVKGSILATNNRAYDLGSRERLAGAERLVWWGAEADVSIRPGWFYHAAQDDKVKSLEHLLGIYYASVGQNAVLLLNVPPDRRGLIHENDAARLAEFRKALDVTFRVNLAAGRPAVATETRGDVISRVLVSPVHGAERLTDGDPGTFWTADETVTSASLEVDLGGKKTFNVALLQEPIALGQRVEQFTLDAWSASGWREFARGSTVGYKRLLRFDDVTTDRVRITVLRSRCAPRLSEFGLYHAPQQYRGRMGLVFKEHVE